MDVVEKKKYYVKVWDGAGQVDLLLNLTKFSLRHLEDHPSHETFVSQPRIEQNY